MAQVNNNPSQRRLLNKQARGEFGMLSAMFLLGMAVNLIGLPSETTGNAKLLATILLGLHVVIGIGLVVGGTLAVLRARSSAFVKQAQIGLVIIILTFLSGVIYVATKNNWWSYAMSVGFIASFWIYGMIFFKTLVEEKQ